LDYLECDDQVNRSGERRQREAIAFHKSEIGRGVLGSREFDRFGGPVDPKDAGRGPCELCRAVTRAAPRIDDLLAAAEAGGESIACQMLVEEIGVDLSWNHSLAGEFSQAFSPRRRSRAARAAHSPPRGTECACSRRSGLQSVPSARRLH